ncbi:AAA family ATPase [Pontibacter oryzae]|uniref:Endonuclease GajA/Old nuclease/RecF-like AAA domain-containing protein n=1 Tax=Pontibacter oryzae TaxID=2304593 RepID=A0A399SCM8_9BACT|nr:AAA family ATPase [Pontibacter oryzae]RIJ41836.1 hypothetical protein D1627_07420 [Pontibacter oryzae]
MRYPFESINLNKHDFKEYTSTEGNEFVSNLSKINIFIGTNNSGKSRFARTLFSKNDFGVLYRNVSIDEINNIIEGLKVDITKFYSDHRMNDYGNVQNEIFPKLKPLHFFASDLDIKNYLVEPLKRIASLGGNGGLSGNVNRQDLATFLRDTGENYLRTLEELGIVDFKPDFRKIYIPTLRGLRTLGRSNGKFIHEDIFLERTKVDYFPNIDEVNSKIYTGLSLYEDTKSLLLGTKEDRDKIKNFEDFLSSNFFNNQPINIIPRQGDDVVHVLLGSRELPIYNLGDGIQAIIVLTYPLFFNQGKEMKIFIEEPEHYLHPGFQRVFMETLVRPEFDSFQYFITTHSNHLLDITVDLDSISVYTFKSNSKNQFLIENVENEDTNILELIGVRNASVFLSNCTIWVEGITDRIYIRKYLEIYQNSLQSNLEFKEDTHYSFVEYGGGNITHWSFLNPSDPNHKNIEVKKLCGKLFLISDKDGAGLKADGQPDSRKKKKYERHEELKKNLGTRYYCLESREIENTLSSKILKSIVTDYETRKGNKNFSFTKFTHDDYKDKSLGKYLNNHIVGRKRDYSDDSETINDKLNFAKKAVERIKDLSDLTDDAKNLVERIYSFIKDNN